MGRRLLLYTGAIALMLTLTACAELLAFLPPAGPPLADDADASVRAAAAAEEEVAKKKEADRLANEALAENDPSKLAQALRLRPNDPDYHFKAAAFQMAAGSGDPADTVVEGMKLLRQSYPLLNHAESLAIARSEVLDAALELLPSLPEGSPQQLGVRMDYCRILAAHQKDSPDFAGVYPTTGCP